MNDEVLAICLFLATRPALLADLRGFSAAPAEFGAMTVEDLRYDTVIDAMRSVAYGQGITLDDLVAQLLDTEPAAASVMH
ncbi:hypothetical protein [Pseudomonas typographi]|uniref:Uncharacterized protein n=1 Tax=Pseudomonas typographi TaxID=2715964 RepID=A0ABR7Z7V3_9PSED|nr:hypothetical protein [Pseudomonas typographi]MBD1554634.1 hypothetical protein [Pseudomonas typographi]MBD1587161.1 hypothetical protein [Pseudomonas typographi]MBD1601389.1 hypothetical protein [Pseudomonas typographi]